MAQLVLDYGGDVNWIINKQSGDTFLLHLVQQTKFKQEIDRVNNIQSL
jgi:hypothetical protein